MKAIAHVGIDGADEAEEQGMEVLAGGEAGGNRGFREEVEDKAVWHGNDQT